MNNNILQSKYDDWNTSIFIGFASLIIIFRFALTADLGVHTIYAPHDELLYILRAYSLLTDGSLGIYDARTLVKLPGFSFFLAALRFLGLPYLQAILIFQAMAGLYLLWILKRVNVPVSILLVTFTLYVFNPVSFDAQSFRVLREPIALVLQVTILGAMGYIFHSAYIGKLAWLHVVVLSLACSSLMLIREEDVILYGVLVSYATVFFLIVRHNLGSKKALRLSCLVLTTVLFTILTTNASSRFYIFKHYGAPILHDFGEGEFPKLIAAIRSIETKKDNRLVMPSQDVLLQLREKIPETIPLVIKLPRPGSGSDSCARFGVCSEWTSGWMYFWLKDAAFASGLTPDLPSSQAYFKHVRMEIENACSDGRLQCSSKGEGMFPPFEFRWTRAIAYELTKAIGMMIRPPFTDPEYPQEAPVDEQTMKFYKIVTMSSYDSPLPTGIDDQLSRKFLSQKIISPFHKIKYGIEYLYNIFGSLIILSGFLSFLYLLWSWRSDSEHNLIIVMASMATVYACIRLFALSYLSIYMGTLDPRLYFSTYIIALLFSLHLLFLAIKYYRISKYKLI